MKANRASAICLALLLGGCSSRLPHEGPEWEPARQANEMIFLYDRDADGVLNTAELQASPGLKASLQRCDGDLDGCLSEREIAARLSFYRDCRDLRLPVVCEITRDGRPLVGAVVRAVPDEALANVIETAEGTTDSQGRAALVTAEAAAQGLHPGMFTVEVTSSVIPEGQATFGLEAAPDGGPEGLLARFEVGGR